MSWPALFRLWVDGVGKAGRGGAGQRWAERMGAQGPGRSEGGSQALIPETGISGWIRLLRSKASRWTNQHIITLIKLSDLGAEHLSTGLWDVSGPTPPYPSPYPPNPYPPPPPQCMLQ